MRPGSVIALVRAYTLPELARAQGIKSEDYGAFVAEVARRVEVGELRITTITVHGWQLPVVVPCPAAPLEKKGTST